MAPDLTLDSATWQTTHEGRQTVHIRCVRLDVVSGPDAGNGREFSQDAVRIGTHRRCDLVLTDRRVSRFQCSVSLEEGGYRVRDLGSTNGTFVDGLRINDAFVPPGARIRIGQSEVYLVPLGTSVAVAVDQLDHFHGLIGGSVAMRRLYTAIQKLAATDSTVLVSGETGTGKELVAEAIHEASPRRGGPLVVVDCGAVPIHLFEDELFGHERGAFTGASTATAGAFERAHGGTLFLDEIGELPLELQPKLLRAVESRRVRRIGGAEEIACDVRLVAATNRDLPVEVNRRTFRSDLYYRLAVAHLEVAPLRARREDIPALVEHFRSMLPEAARRVLAPEVLDRFARHDWPGNVRELRNAVESASLAPSAPGLDQGPAVPDRLSEFVDPDLPFKDARRRLDDAFERRYLTALLERHDWNVSAVSRAARLDRMTVYKLLSRLGLTRPPG